MWDTGKFIWFGMVLLVGGVCPLASSARVDTSPSVIACSTSVAGGSQSIANAFAQWLPQVQNQTAGATTQTGLSSIAPQSASMLSFRDQGAPLETAQQVACLKSPSAIPGDGPIAQRFGQDGLIPAQKQQPSVHGSSTLTWRGRFNGDGQDQDFYHYFNFTAEDLVPGHLRAVLSLRQDWDLDGSPPDHVGDDFYSVDDHKRWLHTDLSTAYFDFLNPACPSARVRLGRQYLSDFEYFHADAVSAEAPIWDGLKWSGFAGQTVSYYAQPEDDWAGGLALTFAPSWAHRLRLAYIYNRDAEYWASNQAFSLESWQACCENLWWHGRFRVLDGSARDVGTDLQYLLGPCGTTLNLGFYSLLKPLKNETNPYDPYTRASLGEWLEHQLWTVRASQPLAGNFCLSGGAQIRRLTDDPPEDSSRNYDNQASDQYDVTLAWSPCRQWNLAVGGQHIQGRHGNEQNGLSSDVTFRPWRCLELCAGTTLGDYTFAWRDELVNSYYETHPDQRAYYAGVKLSNHCGGALRLRYEVEDWDDQGRDPYQTARVSFTQQF